ncbi:MAG: hypothetical protein KGM16_01265 [Bacteroidota bacterium]|nr:hypothetical protein [Bacteroidota bacterium]
MCVVDRHSKPTFIGYFYFVIKPPHHRRNQDDLKLTRGCIYAIMGRWNLCKEPHDYYYSSASFYEKEIDNFGFLKHIEAIL